MSLQRISLKAGVPFRRDIIGKLLLIDDCGVAGAVDVQMLVNGSPEIVMPNRLEGFRRVAFFDGVILTAAVDTIVRIFLSMEDVQLGVNKLQITNDNDTPLPIRVPDGDSLPVSFAGTVEPVFGVATIDNNDDEAIPFKQKIGAVFTTQKEKLTVIVDHAAAVINTGVAQLLINDPTFKRARFRNESATARVAIGGISVTLANAAIILEPGDMWTEDDAAGAAWYATSDIAAANVRVMGLK